MDQIDGADVQRRGHAHASATRHQALDEIEIHLSVVEAPIDVRARDVEKTGSPQRFRERHEEAHRERGGLAVLAFE